MLAQAEQIAAQSEVEPYERFAVIETDEGYGIWDDLHDGLYVDPQQRYSQCLGLLHQHIVGRHKQYLC